MRPTSKEEAPKDGVRFELALDDAPDEARHVYRGTTGFAGAVLPTEVIVTKAHAVATVRGELDAPTRARVEKTAAALVRAATRTLLEEGAPLPRKIVRWRALDV